MKNLLASILSLAIFMAMGATLVYAQTRPGTSTQTPPGTSAQTPPGTDTQTPPVSVKFTIPNPFNFQGDLFDLVKKVLDDIVLPIGAVLCVLAFIYSGFLYVTAQGNSAQITRANDALINSAIGTAVLLGSWTIASVIKGTINQLK